MSEGRPALGCLFALVLSLLMWAVIIAAIVAISQSL